MSLHLPPPPLTGLPIFDRWLAILWRYLQSIPWTAIDYSDSSSTATVDTTLTDAMLTVVVTTSGATITLPAASASRIGNEWTIILGVSGYTTITRSGSDTLTLPEADTSIRLDTKGTSVTLRCLTATSWGIV
jgi:hypothetical protein